MSSTERSPRERIVFSAAQLIRRRGVTATVMRDVVDHAGAPRGSLQHYFPGGKQQLVGEALGWAGRYASGRVPQFVAASAHPSPGRLFQAMVQQWVDEFTSLGFEAGCPLAAATVDCAAADDATRVSVADGFAAWRAELERALADLDVPKRTRRDAATLMLSALEGAILLARAERDVAPLRTVARRLGPILDDFVPSPRHP